MLSSIKVAQAEAELKRQRERSKAKDRKKRRSSGGARKEAPSVTSTAPADEEFIAFSKFSGDDAQQEMDDIAEKQQQMVDEDAAEVGVELAEEEQQEPEETHMEAAEDAQLENQDVEMADAADADANGDDDEEEEQIADDADEEILPSSDDEEESEAAEEDAVPLDVVDPNLSDAEQDAQAGQETEEGMEGEPRASPLPDTPAAAFATPKGNKSIKRSSTAAAAVDTSAVPSTQLSTFSFATSQVSYDASSTPPSYLLSLRSGDTLTFHGSVEFMVEEGYVQVHGHVFNPRSKRWRRTRDAATDGRMGNNMEETNWFSLHSWQHQPHALLSLQAKSSSSTNMDEFVAQVRLRQSQSRFALHRVQALQAGLEMPQTQPPTPCADPYTSTSSDHADVAVDTQTTHKTPSASAKKKNKKQKLDSTPAASATASSSPSSSFLRLNIPGFHPVLRSDEEWNTLRATNVAATDTDSVHSSTPRTIYSQLTIPDEWELSMQSILQSQVPNAATSAADDDESEQEHKQNLSKSQLQARKIHLKSLRQQILSAGLRILVFGARNSGKSTLAIHMLNLALNKFSRVLFLDLDVGQSTFNPPGMIGLHEVVSPVLSTSCHVLAGRSCLGGGGSGASTTSSSSNSGGGRMVWSHFVGDASQSQDPSKVLYATREAVRRYSEKYGPSSGNTSMCPLIVNTQGWLTGLGLELLQTTVKQIVEPVYLIEVRGEKEEDHTAAATSSKKRKSLSSANDDDSSEDILGSIDHAHQLYIFRRTLSAAFSTSLIQSSSIATAQKLRQMQLLGYLTSGSTAVAASNIPLALSSYASILSTLRPIAVPFDAVALQVISMDPERDFDPASILSIFNASLVGLCVRPARDQRKELVAKSTGVRILTSGLATPPFEDGASFQGGSFMALDTCLGQGVKGKLELPNLAFGMDSYAPTRLVGEHASGTGKLPYLSTSSLSAGSGLGSREMSSRHNIQRKRLA